MNQLPYKMNTSPLEIMQARMLKDIPLGSKHHNLTEMGISVNISLI